MTIFFDENDEKLKWTQEKTELLLSLPIFDIQKNTSKSQNGISGQYYVLDAPEWCIIIPEINDDFLMVKQWRHGINELSIEFPGGVVDKNELPENAAKRELLEETGFITNKITKIGELNPNPALFNNKVHIFLAQDLQQQSKQNLDEDEFINFLTIPKNEVIKNLGTPQFPHALMCTAMFFYLKNNF